RKLFLAPTRELAQQIQQEIQRLGRHTPFRSQLLIGGVALQRWARNDVPHMLVSTPGRLLTLLEAGEVELDGIDLLVIDEADRMLDIGLGPDVLAIVETMAHEFQAALFSATLAGEGIDTFAEAVLDDPVTIQLADPDSTSEQVQQCVFHADNAEHKRQLLRALLTDPACQRALVFTNRKRDAEALEKWLREQGLSTTLLHGDLPAPKRLERIAAFRDGRRRVLVSTDLAARGLDVPDITHVINFDLPHRADIYIHRIGRTGRGQRVGIACSLVTFDQYRHLERIEYRLGQSLPVEEIDALPLKGAPFEERLREQRRRLKQLKREKRRKQAQKPARKRKVRHRDRKNKGRPRWLGARRDTTS
ncbi:DEAD/DEAH box helicase, partial [Sulfurivirga sp.]|uniref:DEAD/DEAH box helicase n=1 Tax=Sulfurivirga sp. TaxID=2614236 RepID=UPI0025D82E54